MPELDPDDDDARPKPEALLARAAQEATGRLKIFLGAAPGVGKTFEMLQSGRTKRREGVDVVIGVVETHGRAETRALLRGYEITPRRMMDYKGQQLDEMDIDAILERRPALVLVDELAHTNAPGSRHPKRYLDVLELLDQGIDVYTTLNIQHVESLNDVVAQITGIRVRETVPDSVIDRADDIEIIDITPDDLIKRLHEGKVYLPTTASRAIRNYFSPGNLTALRELALRRTAQRVDEQLLNHMQAKGLRGPWPSGDRVLVCIDESTLGPSLVRYAKRQADPMRASWAAIHVELPHADRLSEEEKDRVVSTLRLAEQLGAETITVPGQEVVREVLRYANGNNYSHIIISRSARPRWFSWFRSTNAEELMRRAGNISVHVIPGQDVDDAVPRKPANHEVRPFSIRPYVFALGYVAVALGVSTVLSRMLDVRNIAIVFLMAVLGSAATAGLGPALFASVVGALIINFFYLLPTFTFVIHDLESVVALVFFLGAAVLTSNLTARVHRQARVARHRARTTEDLYLFAKRLTVAGTLDDVLWVSVNHIATILQVNSVILLPKGGTVSVSAGFPPDDTLAGSDIAAAHWAWEHNRPAGRGADTLPGAKRLYIPLRTGRMVVGVVGLDSERPGPLLSPDQSRIFDALADLAALAIERIQLVEDLERAHVTAEADKLRSALLTSISHDLRAPLAGVMGAADTLRDYFDALEEGDRRALLGTILDESARLNRFIANLLDMTRIESGMTMPNLAATDLGEVIGASVERASRIAGAHHFEIAVAPEIPLLHLDSVLMEQALFNLLDNAAKYSPDGSTVLVEAWPDNGTVVLRVVDQGAGILAADLSRVFDMFYRVRKADSVQAGTGLGLAICRGFIEAMGGTISASNRVPDRSGQTGAIFTIRLPMPTPDQTPAQQETL